jgi:hypothetical protein
MSRISELRQIMRLRRTDSELAGAGAPITH